MTDKRTESKTAKRINGDRMAESTPYDDVYRTLQNDCRRWLLPMLNEIFGEHYTGREEIIPGPNEHFLNCQDGREQERVTDTTFTVLSEKPRKYHIECQANPDGSMMIRMFEYDSQIALDSAEVQGYTMTVTFPRSAVLFLRHNRNTPEKMTMEIRTEAGALFCDIPIMKLQLYKLEDIFEKKLLLLLPFYIFNYEKEFSDPDETLEERIREDFLRIREFLEGLTSRGELTEYERGIIMDMTKKVVMSITGSHPDVRKRLEGAMVGKILDCETKQAYRKGVAEGISQGITQGIAQGEVRAIMTQVCRKLKKGTSTEKIAGELEMRPEALAPLLQSAEKYAPDYDVEMILAEMFPPQADTRGMADPV